MTRLFSWFLAFMLLLHSGCELEKDIDYTMYYEGEQLVAQGYLANTGKARVWISKTTPPFNQDTSNMINNATAYLVVNDSEQYKLTPVDDYEYMLAEDIKIDYSSNYKLQVIADDLPTINSSAQQMIAPVAIDSIKVELPAHYGYIYFNTTDNEKLSFKVLKTLYYSGVAESAQDYSPWLVWHGYNFINNIGILESYLRYKWVDHKNVYPDSIRFFLVTYSDEFCKYAQSAMNYDSSKDNPFYEYPFPFYTNIENGYGIFSTLAIDSVTVNCIDMKDE